MEEGDLSGWIAVDRRAPLNRLAIRNAATSVSAILMVVWVSLLAPLGLATDDVDTPEDREWLESIRENIGFGRELSEQQLELEDYLRDVPESALARLLLIEVLLRRGELDQARRQVELATDSLEDHDQIVRWAQLGFDVYHRVGDRVQATASLQRGLSVQPDAASLLSRRVMLLSESGEQSQAREVLNQLPATPTSQQGDPLLLLEHARAALAVGLIERANRCAVYSEYLLGKQGRAAQAEALRLLGDTYRAGRTDDGLSALEAYRSALEIDSSQALCHAGIARTYIYRIEYDRAEEALQRAFGLDPQLPEAFAIEAELRLMERRFSEGLTAADRGLEINPHHRPLLATRAAALELLGDDRKEAALTAMLAVDPSYADGFRLIGDLVAQNYRFAESLPYFERALEIDAEWALTYVGMARSLANLGRTDEALEALNRFRELDTYRYPQADNTRQALQEVAGFVAYPSDPFTFFMNPVESRVLGPLLSRLYERVWPDFCERYQIDGERPIRVEVFSNNEEFTARSLGFVGIGILGVCFGDTLTVVSPRSEMRGGFHYERTAVHELAHVVSLRLSNQRVPRWLTEGMSVYEERVFEPYCDRDMDLELLNYYASGEIPGVLELNRLFAGSKMIFGYYLSGLLVEHIVEHYGQSALVELLQQYAINAETPAALQAAVKVAPEQFDRDFIDWILATKLDRIRVQPRYSPFGRRTLLDRLPRTEPAPVELLAQIAWAYHQAGKTVDRDEFIGRSLKVDAEHARLQFLLAEIAIDQGRVDEALERLQRGFENGGDEFFAHLRHGEILVAQGNSERALVAYERAKNCFPNYVGFGNPYVVRAQVLEELGRIQESLQEWRDYCEIQEVDTVPRWILANAAMENENYEEAEKYLLQVRSVDPFQRDLHRQIAKCQRFLARPSDAIESINLALAVDAETDPSYDPSLAEELREQADRSARAELILDLVEIYAELGEATQARSFLEEARRYNPSAQRIQELDATLLKQQR